MVTKRSSLLLILGLLVLLPAFAQAQGRIAGSILDGKSKDPLVAANVFIQGTNYGAATDLKGDFVIASVPVGDYKLVVRYIGYQEKIVDVSVKVDETTLVEIAMDFQSIQGEVVEVTAQAEGQIAAINQQLSSNTIANVVSQARIRELPDVNAAESIGRLPGVSIQRSGGEATKISIRGLSPKYNTVTVNGVRVPATGGDDRSVDLSLISSTMLDGIEVKKAITPDMDADAIGGTVDLRLREASDQFSISASAQTGYNRVQKDYGNYSFTASVSNRFLGSRLGAIASFNTDEYDRSSDKFTAGYDRYTVPTTNEPSIRVTSLVLREETVTRGRTGGSLLLDYRLTAGKITMNSFYNRLKSDGLYRINDIDFNANRHYYDMERREGTTSIFTGALGIEQDYDWLRFDAGVSRTASRADNPEDFQWRFGQESNVFPTVFPSDTTHPVDIPTMIRINPNDTRLHHLWVQATNRDENVWTTQLNIEKPFRFGDQITGYFKTGIKGRWLDRRNDEYQRGRQGLQYGGSGNLNDPFEQIVAALPELNGVNLTDLVEFQGFLPIGLVQSTYNRDDFLSNSFNRAFDLGFVYNESNMMALTRALQQSLGVFGPIDTEYRINAIGTRGRDYDGVERYKAGYVMAEFNLGRHITFIPGVRWEDDYSKYHGQRFREIAPAYRDVEIPADLDTLTNIRKNSFWLPMVHLQLKPTEWMKIRLARTETLTRPDYIQYTPITSIDQFNSTIRANNALLRPAQAANYDAAVSVFNDKLGLVTVAGFYKSIDDLILPTSFGIDRFLLSLRSTTDTYLPALIEGVNVPAVWYQGPTPRLNTFINNPFEATYKGFEIDWQTNFWYLPSIFKGLVLNANYTHIDSETKYQGFYPVDTDSIQNVRPRRYYQTLVDTVRVGRMPDQPSHIANITLGYDFKGFSARFSFLYQTDISTFIHSTNPLLDTFTDDYARFDITVQQKLTRGIELFANFNNLNNRKDASFRGSYDESSGTTGINTFRPSYLEYYGFTMDVGARYRF